MAPLLRDRAGTAALANRATHFALPTREAARGGDTDRPSGLPRHGGGPGAAHGGPAVHRRLQRDGVRGDLRAALRTRPVLGCADEGPTDPATLMLRLDVPALDEAHWLAPVAAVRMGAESDLDEACDLPVHLGHETTSGIELGGLPARIARAPSRRRRS